VALDTPEGGPFELVSHRLGALPLVNCFLGRMGPPGALARWLPARDRRLRLDPAVAIQLVVVNLLAGRVAARAGRAGGPVRACAARPNPSRTWPALTTTGSGRRWTGCLTPTRPACPPS
jgi:hypothetical protein